MWGKCAGYTFVELLIALAVFSAMAVSFAVTLRQGLFSWKIQREDQRFRQETRVIMNQLARDLRNAIPSALGDFVGSEREIAFYKPEKDRIVRVTYRLSPVMSGNTTLHCLKQPIELGKGIGPIDQREITFPGKIQWNFAKTSTGGPDIGWKPEWTRDLGFPSGLRVKFELCLSDGRTRAVYQRLLDFPLGG